MPWETISNLLDAVPDQWLWFSAAAVFVVLFWIVAAYKLCKSRPNKAAQEKLDGWIPTGRIDFSDSQSIGNYILQAEDTRLADSVGGVEHREIRWRKATLDEIKTVVVSYHLQRNLATTANYLVSSSIRRRHSDLDHEQKAQIGKDEAPSGRLLSQTPSLVS